MAVIPHLPYSPDLKKLKLKGCRLDKIQGIQAETPRVLDTLTEKDFQEAFRE
jgi:hypothetical protein